jgi:L-fuculose-phosphate aldolase
MEGSEGEIRNKLVEIAHKCYARGLVPATSGNISARIPGTDRILVKNTGVSLGDVTDDDFVLVNLEGEVLEGGKPSKEWRFHLALLRDRPNTGGVVHLHSPFATAFAVSGTPLPLGTIAGEVGLKKVPVVPYFRPGSEDLAKSVVDVFNRDPVIVAALMADHGTVTVGKTLDEAYYTADLLEDTARVAIYTRILTGQLDVKTR